MSNKIIANAISAVLAIGLAGTASTSIAETTGAQGSEMMLSPPAQGMERCYGISKAGQNNCGNAIHGCAGEGKVNASKVDWVFVPEGLCKKIVGGSLAPENNS